MKFEREGRFSLGAVVEAGLANARAAVKEHGAGFVALDVGPLGKLLKPLGDLDFEDAVSLFAETVRIGAPLADLIFIETMSDAYETKAAVLAAKENCALPVFVTNAYGEDGRLLTGADPKAMVALLEGLRVDALGINCGLSPKRMLELTPAFAEFASVPLIVNPNAGLPKVVNGETVFDIGPEEFSRCMAECVRAGARIIGGCCGTTPEHIRAIKAAVKGMDPAPPTEKTHTLISCATHALEFGKTPVLIGERINPTGKKRLREALRAGDIDYILSEGIDQQSCGADALDVNVGLPEIDEPEMMEKAVKALQAVVGLPLQIDSSDPRAMERAMRCYNGKPLINSVNGKESVMEAVFPLVKKYGGAVIALTLDDGGIPGTAEGRAEIAERIYGKAAAFGIAPKDIIVDPLAMAVSADEGAARAAIGAIRLLKERRGSVTSLGVSNISFGLPERDIISSTFFTMALEAGLDAAIINPRSRAMMSAYRAWMALSGKDRGFGKYIEYASGLAPLPDAAPASGAGGAKSEGAPSEKGKAGDGLGYAIMKGLASRAAEAAKEALKTKTPIGIIDGEIIPALDTVGQGFEKGTVFLPQLLMSADAATAAFGVVKEAIGGGAKNGNKIILATVRGDIHDIGKNILRVLLENYGFEVVDLGRDVPPGRVAEEAAESGVRLVGLSALMTTTVPSMEETIRLLREKAPGCLVMVGGAVLTPEYAAMIGADSYSKDAMGAVRYAEKVFLAPS